MMADDGVCTGNDPPTSAMANSNDDSVNSTTIRPCSIVVSEFGDNSGRRKDDDRPMDGELLNDLNGLLLDSKEKDKENRTDNGGSIANGMIASVLANAAISSPEMANIEKMTKLYEKYSQQCQEIEKMERENQHYRDLATAVSKEREALQQQLRESNQNHMTKSQEYERRLIDLESQIKVLRDRSTTQETHFRKTLTDQQAKFNTQIDQLKRSTDQAHRDKDAAVIKYAQREKELLTMEANVQRSQQQAQQMTVERDALNARLRAAKNEKQQLVQVVEQKDTEIVDLKKEVERVKTFIHEADLRVKFANKRVEDTENAQKEWKLEQEKLQKKLKEAREETEMIRGECQRMIKNFQEATEKKTLEIEVQKQEHSDQDEIFRMVADELEALKRQHKETLVENEIMKTQISSVDERLEEKDRQLREKTVELDSQRESIDDLKNKLESLETCAEELSREQKRTRDFERMLTQSRQEQEDCERDSAQCRANAERMLELMEQLTQKNSVIQAEKCSLATKLETAESQNTELTERCADMEIIINGLEEELQQLKCSTSTEIQQLRDDLSTKSAKERQLSTELDDERNQVKVLKKKHAASLKELRSELSILRRRLEAYESGTASQGSGGSLGGDDTNSSVKREFSASRASSYTSLDAVGGGAVTCHRVGDSPVCGYENVQHHSIGFHGGGPQHQGVCEHNQAMIEKIVKLQRMLARRTEKIEFLEEHAKQLVAELQKKSRLLQMYALRDESGALAPESMDMNKAQLAKRGQTVMGSVYGSSGAVAAAGQQQALLALTDGQLTLDLALQIIRKLQALFEDTLLKNITLKDNMETLGEEIARISRENRELKLRYESSQSK